jgi:hypothetical protein
MTNLDPVADKVVRDAVDAYLDGYSTLASHWSGEAAFETKNSRYRLVDGIVVAAPDDSLVGSELVGWFIESPRGGVVQSAWQPGSRAVLVDRHQGRNIIVTSMTRLFQASRPASPPAEPAFLPRGAPVLVMTPEPPPYVPAPAPSRLAAPHAPPQKRSSAIHLPPRPIASASSTGRFGPAMPIAPQSAPWLPERASAPPASSPRAIPNAPFGGGPPSSSGVTARPHAHAGQPADDAWEVTSSELLIEEPPPSAAPTDAPIPLVRPVQPPRPRR